MKNKIKFHSKTFSNNSASEYSPKPSKDFIPEWYLSKDKYITDGKNKKAVEFYKTKDGSIKLIRQRTYKTCPALLDSLSSGYILSIPCDIKISQTDGLISIVLDDAFTTGVNSKNGEFCFVRGATEGFPTPKGYSPTHLVWNVNWFPELPDGHVALFAHPINRFDLPFMTISGIIDCSGYINGGQVPFFIKDDFEGIIEAGTPFIQIIPFKNEAWQHENIFYDEEETEIHRQEMNTKYRVVDLDHDTNYKQKFWSKKIFK